VTTVSKNTYRSAGKGVNCTDDMVRVTITLTLREFRRIEARLEAVLKLSEVPMAVLKLSEVPMARRVQPQKGKSMTTRTRNSAVRAGSNSTINSSPCKKAHCS
jgi:hypothetical protein